MARVTTTEVKDIMDNCTTGDTTIQAMIDAATDVVTEVLSGAGLTDARLKEIERWLVAHMLSATVFRFTSEEKVGDASAKFTGKWGEGLSSTSYGQMVLMLDTSGKMANSGKRSASISAVVTKEITEWGS